MKLVAYRDENGRPAVGVQLDDGVMPTGHTDIKDVIIAGRPELDRLNAAAQDPPQLVQPKRWAAPVSASAALLLAGGNYTDHLIEAGLRPNEPVFFAKLRSAVIGPGEAIRIPTPDSRTDWEAELCIVISQPAYRVPAERAHDYIFGYTMINDVSARNVMDREPLQITLCKSADTFCPLGPHVITADDVGELSGQEISTTVNGVEKQGAALDTMLYSIAELLEFLTRTVTLQPGDVMSTGTPGGTGMGRTPPEFLRPGDTVTVGVTRVGYLSNTVVADWNP